VRSYVDLQGKEVDLGRFLGRGGEGAVYSVPMRPRLVAKIYARTPDDKTGRKLGAMVQLGTEELTSLAAWPQDLLFDKLTGSFAGFLMPRVDGHREIHALYGPTTRKTAFPDATWAFLVRAARNLAAVFDTVHRHGHVVGDVNQGNVVVSHEATVRLIDCDSFQITHLGRTYPCRVGVSLFTPPELQGQRLEDIVRTPDHDRFGLAVLVFQLLFMGRHPFAGRHPERAIPVETAIRECLFAFGGEGARQGWEPPPFSLRLTDIPSPLGDLFERAFGKDAASGGPRPTAADWITSLDELEMMAEICSEDPRHVHVKANCSCPWCRIEKDGGPSFFFLEGRAVEDSHREWVRAAIGVDQILVLGENPVSREALTPTQGFVLSRVDGSLSAREVIDLIPLDPQEVERSLLGLLQTGVVEAKPHPLSPREILQAFEGLKTRTHYEVLGIAQSATEAQIKGAYFRLAKRFHPDKHLGFAFEDLRPKREAIFVRLAAAYEVLRTAQGRAAYDDMLLRWAAAPGAGTPRVATLSAVPASVIDSEAERELAEETIRRAKNLLEGEKYWDSVQLLQAAIPRITGEPRSEACILLARAYAMNPNWLKRAEQLLQELLRNDPQNVDALLALARVYKKANLITRARALFLKVLALDPWNREARAEVGPGGGDDPSTPVAA
jgi:hypothetical protein